MRRRLPITAARSAAIAAAGAVVAAGCGAGRAPSLVDGSRPPAPPRQLRHLDRPVVLGRVSVLRRDELGRAVRRCVRDGRTTVGAAGEVVVRTGVVGTSVTFADASGRFVRGCDGSLAPHEHRGPWCGRAVGERVARRLSDPRLNVGGCASRDGDPVAFAWVDPAPGARWVAVEQPSYTEVYRVVAGLPVRIASTDRIDVERSAATFGIAHYNASGKLLRRHELRAVVAG